jgi:DNA-binding NarL/FixJ family response regulator
VPRVGATSNICEGNQAVQAKPVTVLLIDDHLVVRTGFRRLLETSGRIRVVAEAGDGEEGCRLHAKHEPDVVVVDLSLPGMGGLEVIRRIKARGSRSAILVFSMHDNALLAERALRAGALGYLTKSSSSEHMVEAVLTVGARKRYLGPDIAQRLALNRISDGDSPFGMLSQREFELFRLVAEGNSSRDIAKVMHLTPKTVSNYLSQIKRKLDVASSAELVHLAIQHGILQSRNDSPLVPGGES